MEAADIECVDSIVLWKDGGKRTPRGKWEQAAKIRADS
jgi:hypothetical protein